MSPKGFQSLGFPKPSPAACRTPGGLSRESGVFYVDPEKPLASCTNHSSAASFQRFLLSGFLCRVGSKVWSNSFVRGEHRMSESREPSGDVLRDPRMEACCL